MLLGIAVEDARYRFLEVGLHRIRKSYLYPREGLTQEQIRPYMSTKVLVNEDPEMFELKGEGLLQNRRLRMHSVEILPQAFSWWRNASGCF